MSVAPPSPPLTWRYGSSSFCPFCLALLPFRRRSIPSWPTERPLNRWGSLPSYKVRHVFSHWSTTRKRTRGQCPRSHEQTPLCSSRASKIHPQILEIWRGLGGLYSRIHLCPFFVFSFLKSSRFNSFPSLLFLPQALVLSVSSSMKEPKRVSSQLWLAMHCCTTSSWPGSSAACSMVLVWKSGTETQTTVMPRLNWGEEESIYKLAVWSLSNSVYFSSFMPKRYIF